MTISSSSVLDARARICERCCSYQHKKTRRRKSEPPFASSSSSSSTTTKVAAAAVVVASSSTQRNDENERTTSTTTKTHSNRRAFLVSSTSLFSLCVAAIARYPLPSSKIAAHAATITIQNEEEVRKNLRQVLESKIQKTKCPAVLRVAFHDAGTFNKASNDGGMNGSVLYELGRPESFGLKRGLNPIKEVYEEMKVRGFGDDTGGVSLADCIACAGAYAIELTGGPKFLESIPLGRRDASSADPENRMPVETLRGKEMREHFQNLYGLSSQEMIALSGAHTIGQKGFGDPYTFDNEYFVTLKKDPWNLPNLTKDELEMNEHIGLLSDRYLAEDEENKKWINKYAEDAGAFNKDFVEAYIKLTTLGV
ncbi:ascorbate peroxidase [Bathycoccus prasinos]|uniref:L-ascorbate peroxidase n=1 Tax=Bathycoccus prasinos TaxID=41875 RepID=K8EEA4_9CHLO|nr:ascorbate peroxidase [Bathycoccus prasinos]CCO16304.1 ascorbate peroxidase [Bathycoccus prasinos]|mmetsp:Transcript_1844/g.5860  ORF Transcript_1844/g.5860 Transcript_1844/m.5860 type:complete len:367 (+) Transcript_1844:53-1153(+)|eukprot:XP_007513779.1 ascorbate peroxidase [Bathycoccus prasinos]